MSYSITWLVEKRVIHVKLENEVTIDEAERINQQLLEFFDAGAPPLVHMICDTSRMSRFPTNLGLLNDVSSTYMKHRLLGWVIVIGSNPMARFIGSIITQVFRVRFRMVPSFPAAVDFLAEVDSTVTGILGSLDKTRLPNA